MDTSFIYCSAGLLAYVVAGRLVMRWLAGAVREFLFAVLNLTGVFFFLFYGGKEHFALRFGIYVVLIIGLYLLLRLFAERRSYWPWVAFFAPIAALVVIRYVPASAYVAMGQVLGQSWRGAPKMIGISYLVFRCSRLVLEVRNGVVPKPTFLEYLNFAFFLPTMSVGPINTYANFRHGFTERYDVPIAQALLRVFVGAAKYEFLGGLCNQLSYTGLLLDYHPHH